MPRMPFGKHKGLELCDVPDNYLDWLLSIDLRPRLRRQVESEVQARRFSGRSVDEPEDEPDEEEESSSDLQGLIRAWHRELVMKYHPDRGGCHEAMIAINDACERLRRTLGL